MILDDMGRRSLFCGVNTKAVNRLQKTTWQTPESISPQQVKYRLCADGPANCARCRICAFGRYYVDHGLGNATAQEKAAEAA